MRITLNDFGPISSFEFDLEKDLHVIFGKNNIGKSYAITAVYLTLKNLLSASGRHHFPESLYFLLHSIDTDPSPIFEEIEKTEEAIILKLEKSDSKEVDISDEISFLFNRVVSKLLLRKIENSFKNSFASIRALSNQHSKKRATITLSYRSFIIIIGSIENYLEVSEIHLSKAIFIKKASVFKKPLLYDDRKVIYYNSKEKSVDLVKDCLDDLLFDLGKEIKDQISHVYFLPASRSGLYQGLSTFSSMIAELSKSRNLLTSNKFELPNISETVSDYFLELSNISVASENDFHEIVEQLENSVLNGKISFNAENKKIVFYQKELNEELDLSFTSSMISEIAPIVAYLKYVIGGHDQLGTLEDDSEKYGLIFIEEPEAHLHPDVQIKLMEMFVKLAGKSVKIVMTSHSNYMFNKLSNLLLDGKINPEKVSSYLMRTTNAGSVTDTLSMRAEKDGMNDENFADTAEMLYEERIKIYDRLNNDVANAH